MYASVEGMVVTSREQEYKGKKQLVIDLLQKFENRSIIATVQVPADEKVIPEMGETMSFYGRVYSFGQSMMLICG